jgi:hypothetical protein
VIPLAPAGWAQSEVRAESLVQARTDVVGDLYGGGVQALGGTAALGPATFEGYGVGGWAAGFDQAPGGEVFVLAADGGDGPVTWTLGRQPLLLPTWTRRLDGGSLRWRPGGGAVVDGAIGVGSRSGDAGVVGGAPLARLAAGYAGGPWTATLGGWGELGDAPVAHGDAEVRWAPADERWQPVVGAVAALGGPGGAIERARLEASLRPASGWRAAWWAERRRALAASPTSAEILAVLAPEGTDSVGVGGGWTSRDRHQLWASGSVQRWDAPTPAVGWVGEARWEPRCGEERWCVSPAWSGVSGDGGWLHRAGGQVALPTPSAIDLALTGAWVPWRKPHEPWRSTVVVGGAAAARPPGVFGVDAGCDVVLGDVAPNVRAWLALQLVGGER